MKIISHRGLWKDPSQENSLEAFAASQRAGFGIETDLRSFQGGLYLSHDPILDPGTCTPFENLMDLWERTPRLPLFLNIKEDGLLPLLQPWKEKLLNLSVVFFDMSVPQLIQFSNFFPASHLATRFSEYEENPSALSLCSWLWIDSFHRDPELTLLQEFHREGKLRLAIVSPDLHSRDPKPFWNHLKTSGISNQDSVVLCTDYPQDFSKELL